MMGETFTFSITPPSVFRHKAVSFRWKYFITCNPQSLIQLIHFPCAMCNVHTYLHYIHFLYQFVHLHPDQCSLARCVSIDRVAANKVNMTTLLWHLCCWRHHTTHTCLYTEEWLQPEHGDQRGPPPAAAAGDPGHNRWSEENMMTLCFVDLFQEEHAGRP